ncbi:MAG: hypothetical protein M0T74_01855 [Desulfitobacterium hafniense]|nr:hypothetical protein [Desulfitobacterium hafniense]
MPSLNVLIVDSVVQNAYFTNEHSQLHSPPIEKANLVLPFSDWFNQKDPILANST